ncbi:MAG: Rv3235 family protein [Actinomycetota bacterium]
MSGPPTRRSVHPPAGRRSGHATRPPDGRPPAGPGRSTPAQEWDPVRFRAVGTSQSKASAYERRAAEARPLAGAATPPLPEPRDWAAAVARMAAEALLGIRPANQLSRWLAGPVFVTLSRRAGLAERVAGPRRATGVQVRFVSSAAVDEFTHEASVTLHDGTRFRAAALRLEQYHGRWLVTALEIG